MPWVLFCMGKQLVLLQNGIGLPCHRFSGIDDIDMFWQYILQHGYQIGIVGAPQHQTIDILIEHGT